MIYEKMFLTPSDPTIKVPAEARLHGELLDLAQDKSTIHIHDSKVFLRKWPILSARPISMSNHDFPVL
jgi:hypothetical protein